MARFRLKPLDVEAESYKSSLEDEFHGLNDPVLVTPTGRLGRGLGDWIINLIKSGDTRPRELLPLAALFFVCGFTKVLGGILQPHMRAVFGLTYAQSTLVGSVWFIGYFAASLPAASLTARAGYKRAMVLGLVTMTASAVLLIVAAATVSYSLVLAGLLAMAGGATLLEVAANPYVAVMGPLKTASSRLTFVQTFNAVGSILAPLFGAWLIMSRSHTGRAGEIAAAILTPTERLVDAQAIELPYLLVGLALAGLALMMASVQLPAPRDIEAPTPRTDSRQLWQHPRLVWGILAIAAYMLAEIGCASFFIDLAGQPSMGALTHVQAADYLFLLWGGMMLGRLLGSGLMYRFAPEKVLASASVLAFFLLLATSLGPGSVALWALISVGLFHSIMFPTIFTLAIRGLGPLTKAGSGLLVMAIGGGSLVIAQGWLADLYGPQVSFLLPTICELCVLAFALRCSTLGNS